MTGTERRLAPDPQGAIGSAGPPAAVRYLRYLTDPVERLLDRIFGSKWNPFYQSGNLAVLSFLVSLASGLVLFLWYHIADPHGSVLAIQESVPGGAWLRSLHRYSADLAVVAIAAHLVRKLLQGHTWGPRALAWISGVVLLLVTLFCGWTGLVMVWDVQGQEIAIAGARLLDLLPIFSEPISRSFSGEVPPASSFFFMTLFLHVALPLGLGALLWLHVSRVSRPALLPPRPMIRFLLAALAAAALIAPLELPPAADLLALPGIVPTDLFFAFWLPLSRALSPGAQAALWLGLLVLLSAAPGGGAPGGRSRSPRWTRATAPAARTAIRTAPTKRSRWCRARSSRSPPPSSPGSIPTAASAAASARPPARRWASVPRIAMGATSSPLPAPTSIGITRTVRPAGRSCSSPAATAPPPSPSSSPWRA